MPFASAVDAVGGMSTVWTCSCPRHEDFELPSVLPTSRWRELLDIADRPLSVSTETFAPSFVGDAILEELDTGDEPRYHQLPVVAAPDPAGGVGWTLVTAVAVSALERFAAAGRTVGTR